MTTHIDHRIEKARAHFKISEPSDWCNIRPEWIRQLHGVGPRTVDLIRLYLAARGLTLKEVCRQVHIPQSRLKELEGGVRIPTPGQIRSLEAFFGIDSKVLAELAKPS